MQRRKFLQQTTLATGSFLIMKDLFAKPQGNSYGHNGMQYRMDTQWGTLTEKNPVNDCHEMVEDSKGNILLLTNETKNNILVYDKSGKLLSTWGHEYPGAHGLTIHKENGEDFLFISDTSKHQVYKTTIDGKLLMTIDYPAETGVYNNKEAFVPTETTVLANGDFYIADGYGAQYIMHYDAKGKLQRISTSSIARASPRPACNRNGESPKLPPELMLRKRSRVPFAVRTRIRTRTPIADALVFTPFNSNASQ